MGAYHRNIWDKLLPLLQSLPDNVSLRTASLHQEAMSLANSAKHTTDVAAKQIAPSIAVRRHAWLRSATLPEDAHTYIEDLPFDGVGQDGRYSQ